MTTPPMFFMWDGESMVPRSARAADEAYVIGQGYRLAEVDERSEVSHRHEFAWLREAWSTLPEHLTGEYPSAEHLRKKALIHTGWCNVRDYPCASRAEANRLRATLEAELDDYAVVMLAGDVVRVCRAKSQARNKMKGADFQASKTAVLEYVAGLLEVAPAELERAAA